MVMLAAPLDKLAVGVKTAVRVRPVPLIALKVPPETVRSPVDPFQAKLAPGVLRATVSSLVPRSLRRTK